MDEYKNNEKLNWVSGKVKGFHGKELIEMENGNLKMIKVDPFALYPIHQHPNKTEYAYVLDGIVKIVIGEEIYKGHKGDFFIFPKSTKHSIENPFENDCLLLIGSIK